MDKIANYKIKDDCAIFLLYKEILWVLKNFS